MGLLEKGIVILISALLLLWVAIYNQYPIVTSDSGAYIRFAFDFQVLKDRSPFYSVFLAISGMRFFHTAWLPLFFQSAIVTILIARYSYVLTGMAGSIFNLLAIAIISFTTSLSLTASHLMPDVFTSILLLSALLYVFDRDSRAHNIIYLILVFGCVIIHNSNYIIFPVTIICLLLLSLAFKKRVIAIRAFHLLSTTALSILLLLSLHFVKGFGWTLSPGSHVFLTAKFVETGVMKQYLTDNCGNKQLKLCAYKDELPSTLSEYMWEDYSPFYKAGGWEDSREENTEIINDVLRTPKYLKIYFNESMKGAGKQLRLVGVEKVEPLHEPSSPAKYVDIHLNKEIEQYKSSRQHSGELYYKVFNNINILFLVISTICVMLIFKKLHNKKKLLTIYGVILIFILVNSITASFFSEVTPRFNYRILWVLPATHVIIILRYLMSRNRRLNSLNHEAK